MEPIVEVKNLTKKFNGFTAVDNLSFEIKEGEILGLLGPNGAGKTTTIQMLLGLTTPTGGTIEIFGMDLVRNRSEILKKVNFSSSYVYLPSRLTVTENLKVFCGLYEVPNSDKRIDEILETFEAKDLKHLKFSRLSSGQRTRIMLCKAFLNRPRLLFLDEPTASLDPDLADKTRKYLLELQKKDEISILFTSHNMDEIEEVCDRVIFLNKGKIIAED
ncbi:ABC transporter ATP-binding protein, partial [Candidatus Gottesmanbacteria bacterium]|nr:ABC transporter ATP-binding protein [Candidatus Gottesmanbacteria bacterium]